MAPKKSIIAMKGAPFTRKSEYATLIATSLKCPLLCLEDFLGILGPDNLKINPKKEHNIDSSQPPQNLSMLIIFQIAAKHLLSGVFNHVVIDSPLSCRVEFDGLVNLASTIPNTRVVVVECKPKNLYLWRMVFERSTNQSRSWFKPKIWDEIEHAIQNDCKLEDSLFNSRVSKLVLDPLEDHLYKPNAKRAAPKFKRPDFMEAIEYFIKRNDAEAGAHSVVVFSQWLQSVDRLSLTHKELSKKLGPGNKRCHKEGHHITKCAEMNGDETNICTGCLKKINHADLVYSCNICTLVLHKCCAESFKDDPTFRNPYPEFYYPTGTGRVACDSCKGGMDIGGADLPDCSSCIFDTNLELQKMPVIIWHDSDEHFLSLVLLDIGEKQSYSCSACAGLVRFLFYACRICCKYYHINCVNEIPIRVEHEHGSYDHHLRLMSSTPEEAEDYLCMECLEIRDPLKWFYSCEECSYELHLGCILKKEEIGDCWKWRLID